MRITVTQNGFRKNEIFFTSAYGEGRGIWYGAHATPLEEINVEFELTQLFMRWVDIVPADKGEAGISMDGDRVVFTGILEDIDEDGTGYLRLGESVLMFESLGEPMALGIYASISVKEPGIYPIVV
ncbi:hypothetical protein A8L34_17825 [Bacillus sp. FJAT-27264]|uniref:hypothetical protein n=1 Tax=Paenibacillus sp. (strain DSM 101736 / FJAT-27264) TaxID=1850362 RepID=UPI000807C093|nr:hypothetical protein [Bacillus sp. FJAT-27264]OBZ10459.1 hypothetical protein A8L34_17825 [Bacillus sp. FJAT-27264]